MTPPDQLPAIISPGALATPADTYIVPALIADLGEAANWRYRGADPEPDPRLAGQEAGHTTQCECRPYIPGAGACALS